jgi:cytoskeletal protein CcmA (bactofilin family)/ribosomal protein S27E
VFRGLFAKKSDRPAPPKGQIEVECPTCGAAQYEPRLVVSTFCKKCGVHLSISRGKVSASSASRVGYRTDEDRWDENSPLKSSAPAAAPVTPVPQKVADSATVAQTAPAQPVSNETAAIKVALEKRPQSNSPAPTPAPEPMTASTLQKMKDQGVYKNAYFKDAVCFDCQHQFKVSRSSKSAHCAACGSVICMEDVEVNTVSHHPIKTRGDVLIRKRGHVSAEHLYGRDLNCQGLIEANMHLSGDATFRTSGTIVGSIHCRRFVVERGSEIVFINEVHAQEVEIHAPVTGHIFSSGQLVIGAHGSVNGDVTARAISIEPGGELNGAMNIVRSQSVDTAKVMPKPPAAEEQLDLFSPED